jgi:predicted RNA-binding protein (virulence factor B family)
MPIGDLLGRLVTLPVLRLGPPGVFFSIEPNVKGPGAATLLLPGAEAPQGLAEGDELQVFVYLDSSDRPIATTRQPRLMLGQVAFLEVTDLASFGAFVDWGLPKELLIPHAEQTCELLVGQRHPIGLFIDDTGRLAGTMKVGEMLRDKPAFMLDAWVEGEAWRNESHIGLFVILERRFVGLVPATEPHTLARGDAARFRVTSVLTDGKIELSLRGQAHEELEGDAKKILAVLEKAGAPQVGDRSSPEAIRALFGLSKKAFKRAAGRLLKQRRVTIDARGLLAIARPKR